MKKIFSFLMAALFSTAMFATTYTVVGSSAALFGTAWAPTLEANDMTLVDGIYTIKFEDKTLPAGPIEYKIVTDHSYNVAYPQSGNASFTIEKAGEYDVTFTLNAETKAYNAVAEFKEEAEVDDKAQLAGTFNSWTPADMVLSDDKATASIKVELTQGAYGFKTIINDGWRGNGKSFTREANTQEGISGNGDNMSLSADLDGEYTFTWTFATNALTVTFPEGVVIPAKFYATGDSAFVTDAGAPGKAWNEQAIKSEEDTLELTLKADQEYRFKVLPDGTWEDEHPILGYDELTEKPEGVTADKDKNICFTLQEAGKVQIVYVVKDEEVIFKVIGKFVVPEVAKFYITGSANLVGEEKAWWGDAVKSTEDTYTFEKLAAGKYQLKVTEDGTWDTSKGIDDMSEKAAGLYKDQDANVCFILAEEGDVKVTYKKGEESTEFTLEGAFVAPEIKLIGIDGWEAEDAIALELAEDGKSASKTLELDKYWYDFKVIRADEWLGKDNEGEENYKIHRDYNWVEGLKREEEVKQKSISLQPDVLGEYIFTYEFASGKLTVTFPAEPEPVLANGYYLIGVVNGVESTWDYASLNAEHLFVLNEAAEGEEYALDVTLAENDEFQIVRCDKDKLGAWYPGGEGNNYVVDASHAGKVTVYFRPNGDGGEDWWHKFFYVAHNEPSAIDNTEAAAKTVKVIENGMLIIEKAGVRYNAFGQEVR